MLTIQKISRALLLISVCVAVTSCGFHLRGSSVLAENNSVIYLTAPRGTFELELKDTLASSGASFSYDLASSDMHVDVTYARSKREIGTLDEDGRVNSYRLVLTVSYRVFDNQDKIVKRYETLSENRQYIFDPAEIVESESEEADLLAGMERDIALRISRQLSTIGSPSPVVAN